MTKFLFLFTALLLTSCGSDEKTGGRSTSSASSLEPNGYWLESRVAEALRGVDGEARICEEFEPKVIVPALKVEDRKVYHWLRRSRLRGVGTISMAGFFTADSRRGRAMSREQTVLVTFQGGVMRWTFMAAHIDQGYAGEEYSPSSEEEILRYFKAKRSCHR